MTAEILEHLNDGNFQDSTSKGKWVVHFTSPTCAPCRVVKPILEDLSKDYPSVKFGVIDASENIKTALSQQVTSYPTVIFYIDGRPIDLAIGGKNFSEYNNRISKLLQG